MGCTLEDNWMTTDFTIIKCHYTIPEGDSDEVRVSYDDIWIPQEMPFLEMASLRDYAHNENVCGS